MSDQFVDDLFARLQAERSETLTRAASAAQSRERVVAAASVWWDDHHDTGGSERYGSECRAQFQVLCLEPHIARRSKSIIGDG